MTNDMFRLITRSDFDGLVSAVLLKELNLIDRIWFVHPKDVQDGKVDVTDNDITANLPFADGAHYAFDHHSSEVDRVGKKPNHIIDPEAASTARLIYNSFGGRERFTNIPDDMMNAVDKADSAQFDKEEILNPTGWVLLNFIMDPRTGLGRFHNFRISNYQLMMDLIDACMNYSVDEILALPDVKERVDLFNAHRTEFADQLKRTTQVHNNLTVTDLRYEESIFVGNRFMIYALFPEANTSMHVLWGKGQKSVVFAVGHSILNRTSNIDVGGLMLQYGGGGHKGAGTCQAPAEEAETVKQELIDKMTVSVE